MNEEMMQVGRIALRQEGGMWNAYYAKPDTMDDAVFIGSIRMAAVMGNREVKSAFMELMRAAVSDVIESQGGVKPTWKGATDAPEHERSGSA